MTNLPKNFAAAFAMYSRLPMPRVQHTPENTRYGICFFPFIGVVIGGGIWGLVLLGQFFAISTVLLATLCTALPLLITGGIHLDGFCDTIDALSSHAGPEKKLEILKDPRAGAFAIIYCGILLLCTFGFWHQLLENTVAMPVLLPLMGLGFVLSRCLSGLGVLALHHARPGSMSTFANPAVRSRATVFLLLLTTATIAALVLLHPFLGGLATGAALLCFLHYKHMAYTQFGGITGDGAGYFLQICEMAVLAALALGGLGL